MKINFNRNQKRIAKPSNIPGVRNQYKIVYVRAEFSKKKIKIKVKSVIIKCNIYFFKILEYMQGITVKSVEISAAQWT